MAKCKHCDKHGDHYCKTLQKQISEEDEGDFFMSVAVGAATNNGLLGGIVGGDLAGGIIGDMITPGGLF